MNSWYIIDSRKSPFGLPHLRVKFIEIQVIFYFHKPAPLSVDSNFEKFYVEIIFIDHQTSPKPCRTKMLVVFVVIRCWGPLMNVQSQPGNRRRPLCVMRSPKIFQIWLYYTSRTMLLTCEVPLYTQLEHSVVMSIWNVDAQQRQIGTESCYITSVSHKLSYLLVRIMLLSQDMVTIVF